MKVKAEYRISRNPEKSTPTQDKDCRNQHISYKQNVLPLCEALLSRARVCYVMPTPQKPRAGG